ncbi:MAG: hypothetical protein ACK5ZG_14805 [Phycisphaerae bacterium]|jgi:hypothetical protein
MPHSDYGRAELARLGFGPGVFAIEPGAFLAVKGDVMDFQWRPAGPLDPNYSAVALDKPPHDPSELMEESDLPDSKHHKRAGRMGHYVRLDPLRHRIGHNRADRALDLVLVLERLLERFHADPRHAQTGFLADSVDAMPPTITVMLDTGKGPTPHIKPNMLQGASDELLADGRVYRTHFPMEKLPVGAGCFEAFGGVAGALTLTGQILCIAAVLRGRVVELIGEASNFAVPEMKWLVGGRTVPMDWNDADRGSLAKVGTELQQWRGVRDEPMRHMRLAIESFAHAMLAGTKQVGGVRVVVDDVGAMALSEAAGVISRELSAFVRGLGEYAVNQSPPDSGIFAHSVSMGEYGWTGDVQMLVDCLPRVIIVEGKSGGDFSKGDRFGEKQLDALRRAAVCVGAKVTIDASAEDLNSGADTPQVRLNLNEPREHAERVKALAARGSLSESMLRDALACVVKLWKKHEDAGASPGRSEGLDMNTGEWVLDKRFPQDPTLLMPVTYSRFDNADALAIARLAVAMWHDAQRLRPYLMEPFKAEMEALGLADSVASMTVALASQANPNVRVLGLLWLSMQSCSGEMKNMLIETVERSAINQNANLATDRNPQLAEKPKRTRRERTALWLANAMLTVRDHPEWSDASIADSVGIDKSRLSRSPEYQKAAQMARSLKIPRGSATYTEDISGVEAIDDSFNLNRPASRQWQDEEDLDDRIDREMNERNKKRNAKQ